MSTVRLSSLTDDQFSEYLTGAMKATISALVVSGKLTVDEAQEFCDTHVCQLARKDNCFTRWRAKFWPNLGDDNVVFVVTKIVS